MAKIDDYKDDASIRAQEIDNMLADDDFDDKLQDAETEDSLTADTERFPAIEEVIYSDPATEKVAREIHEEQRRRIDFQNELKERMLQSELVDVPVRCFAKTIFSNHEESVMTEVESRDVEEGKREWSAEYDYFINNPPKEGDVLTAAESGAQVLLVVELVEGNPPFIYGRAYIPEIVGSPLGWYLQSATTQNYIGWKTILLPRARTELIRKFGLQGETMEVESLRVVRISQSGRSLLCEVNKYGDEVEASDEVVKDEVVKDEVSEIPKASPYEEDTSDDQQAPQVPADDALETAGKGIEEDAVLEVTNDELK